MVKEIEKLRLIKNIINTPVTAIFNHYENQWHYYAGRFIPYNPQKYVYYHQLDDCVCIDFILENHFTYFNSDKVLDEFSIKAKYNLLPKVQLIVSSSFDFVQII